MKWLTRGTHRDRGPKWFVAVITRETVGVPLPIERRETFASDDASALGALHRIVNRVILFAEELQAGPLLIPMGVKDTFWKGVIAGKASVPWLSIQLAPKGRSDYRKQSGCSQCDSAPIASPKMSSLHRRHVGCVSSADGPASSPNMGDGKRSIDAHYAPQFSKLFHFGMTTPPV